MNNKIIYTDFCFVFLGHPELDSRILNFAFSLEKRGYAVTLMGFDWFGKGKVKERKNYFLFEITRRPAALFYSKFLWRLNRALKKIRAKVFVAEDIYTLPAVSRIARKQNAKLYYDSRELYAFIGGLAQKPLAQRIIAQIEKKHIRKTDLIITTGEMDADFLKRHYGLPAEKFAVIRNLPRLRETKKKINLRKLLGIPEEKKIIVYQGILSGGRGLEKIVSAIEKIGDAVFVIIGDGPERKKLEKLTREKQLVGKVFFAGMIPNEELLKYVCAADLGVALIENISTSYYYALPNKLFEYIACGLPVIVSPLPQMKKIAEEYGLGILANPENPQEIVNAVNTLFENKNLYEQLRANAEKARFELNWESEFKKNEKQFLI